MRINQLFRKAFVFGAAVCLALGAFFYDVPVSQALTTAQLQSQITSLQAQLAQLLAQLNGTAVTTVPGACAGVSFARNLVLGSMGNDVRCLQAILNQKLDTRLAASGAGSPGNETTFFGPITRAALIRFQIDNASSESALDGASGIAGAQTIARLNSILVSETTAGGGTTIVGLPAGCASASGYSPITGQACSSLLPVGCVSIIGYSPVTGQACSGAIASGLPAGCTSTVGYSPSTGQLCSGSSTTSGGFVINGQAGDFTAALNPSPAQGVRVYAGDSKDQVMGIQIRAIGSDISVQRVTLDLNQIPRNLFTNIYLLDGSTVVASLPLDSANVSRISGTDYAIALQNFQNPFIVSKGTTKVLMVAVDVASAISSDILQYNSSVDATLRVEANGIRAIDQSNTGLFDPADSTTIVRTINVNPSSSATASLTVSRSANSPLSGNISADTNGNITGATILGFDVRANGSGLTIDEIDNIDFTTGSNYIVPQTVYLYDSNNSVVASASPSQSSGRASFTGLNISLSGNAVTSFTIRLDDTLASNGSENGKIYQVTVDASGGNFTVQRPNGTLLPASAMSGAAQSYPQSAFLSGSMFSVQGITTSSTQRTQTNPPTISAAFRVNVTAGGGNIFIPKSGAFHIVAVPNTPPGVAVANTAYNQPSGVLSLANSYEIPQDTTVTFTVNSNYVLSGPSSYYYLSLSSIDWGTSDASPSSNSTDLTSNGYNSNIVFLQ